MKKHLPPLNGLVLIDKPKGKTSNATLLSAKRALQQQKVGHGGTLDPLASGLLPLFFGSWTKLSSHCLTGTKGYVAIIALGIQTDSGDKEGRIINKMPVPEFSEEQLKTVADSMIGKLEQIPPSFSAIKVDGVPSYKRAAKARKSGIKMKELPPRWIEIHELRLRKLDARHIDMKVKTSKGAYIRTLAEEIAKRLNTCGSLVALRRTAINNLRLDNAVTLDKLRAAGKGWIDIETLLPGWYRVHISHEQQDKLLFGQAIDIEPDQLEIPEGCTNPQDNCDTIIALSPEGDVVALGEYRQNRFNPKRVLATA